jgi:hypothetical protein
MCDKSYQVNNGLVDKAEGLGQLDGVHKETCKPISWWTKLVAVAQFLYSLRLLYLLKIIFIKQSLEKVYN